MAQGVCEVIWLRRIFEELIISFDQPMNLLCDNKYAFSIAVNPVKRIERSMSRSTVTLSRKSPTIGKFACPMSLR